MTTDELNKLLKRLNINKRELADKLGINQSTVSRWEERGFVPKKRIEKINEIRKDLKELGDKKKRQMIEKRRQEKIRSTPLWMALNPPSLKQLKYCAEDTILRALVDYFGYQVAGNINGIKILAKKLK